MKQVMIAKVMWNQGDNTFYGPFNSHEEYGKWAKEFIEKWGNEVEEIYFDWLRSVTKDLEEQK